MIIGERDILKGIAIFEEVIKGLNPDKIDDDTMSIIINCVDIVISGLEEKAQHVNTKVHYGIEQCSLVVDIYNKRKKRELVK